MRRRPIDDPLAELPFRYRLVLRMLPSHVRDEHARELRDDLTVDPPSLAAFARDVTGASFGAHWDVLRQDLTHAYRQMRRAPSFAVVAVATLALGVAGNLTFFALVDGVLLRQLPYAGADRIVDITEENATRGMRNFGISPANFRDFTTGSDLFVAAALYQSRSATVRIGESRERVSYAAVSGDFFRVLTDRPLLGRTLQPEDDVPGANAVVLSNALWRRVYGGDESVVGRELDIDGTPLRVVGVMPERFAFPSATTDFWRPLALAEPDRARRGARFASAIARLRPSATGEAASTAASRTAEELAHTYPRTNTGWTLVVRDLRTSRVSGARPALLLVWGAGSLVLLVAIANVASLFLTRAVVRERELALRTAFGARPSRIARQLVTEAMLLCFVSTAAGIGLATILLRTVRQMGMPFVPRIAEVTIGARVVGYAFVLALAMTVLLALTALSSGRDRQLWRALGGARGGVSRRRRSVQRAIVGGETALATFVLIASALIVRTLVALLSQPMGFDARDVVVFRIEPPWRANLSAPAGELFDAVQRDRARASDGYAALVARLEAMPGVRAVGAVNRLPLTGDWWTTEARLPAEAAADSGKRIAVYVRPATPGYLAAIGTRVLRGRAISPSDVAGGEHALVVDAQFAREAWGSADPIGREVMLDGPPAEPAPRARVVGVVESLHMNRLDGDVRSTMYIPFAQATEGHSLNWGMDVVVRAAGGLPEGDVRRIAHDVFPDAAVFGLSTMHEIVSRSTADRRFQLFVLGAFGAFAVLLTTVGVGGTFLLAVRERRDEIALRMALGAEPVRLWWSVQRDSALLTACGAAIGLIAALAGGRIFASLVHGVSVRDPVSLLGATLLVIAAGFVASVLPATRAMRIDPASALRE